MGRNDNPLDLPMTKAQRAKMTAGRTFERSEQPDARNTAPIRHQPEYQSLQERSRTHCSSSKGKGKGKGKDDQWQRDDGWQGEWRGYNYW